MCRDADCCTSKLTSGGATGRSLPHLSTNERAGAAEAAPALALQICRSNKMPRIMYRTSFSTFNDTATSTRKTFVDFISETGQAWGPRHDRLVAFIFAPMLALSHHRGLWQFEVGIRPISAAPKRLSSSRQGDGLVDRAFAEPCSVDVIAESLAQQERRDRRRVSG